MYQLTTEDLDCTHQDDTPVIRAAANPKIAILEALLAYYERFQKLSHGRTLIKDQRSMLRIIDPNTTVNLEGRIQSPINAAIGANLPANLRLLLSAGANLNGIKRVDIADYSVRWIRGRHFQDDYSSYVACQPRVQVLEVARKKKGITHPICPLTEAELNERRLGFPRFWTEPNVPGRSFRSQRA